MKAAILLAAIAACTPKQPDRTPTCIHYAELLEKCDAVPESRDVWIGRCKVAFGGDPNGATPGEAETLARMRTIATCAADKTSCEDYERCKSAK